ncbi:hypothetical protein PQX77_013408 [Marasmius sp. AFHP31]|nr:hypothetical protein PQX77_013408 [Marasmius sp. AFHP31]
MLHWALEYALNVQNDPSLPPHRRDAFAKVYKFARIRSLFYPITPPRPNRVLDLSSRAKPKDVLEYCRRQAVLQFWKERGSLKDPSYRVPLQHSRSSPSSSIPISVAGLRISDDGNDESSPMDEDTLPKHPDPSVQSADATVNTETKGPGSGVEPDESADATHSSPPSVTNNNPPPVDQDNAMNGGLSNTQPTNDGMEA